MNNRAGIFDENLMDDALDLSEFKSTVEKKKVNKDIIKKTSSENNFHSRQPIELNHTENQPRVLKKRALRREQLSSRIQKKHHDLFYYIVNSTGKLNAEVMELAIEALADKMDIKY